MSKKNLPNPITCNLPDNISHMTISEFVSSTDSEIHIKGGRMSVRKSTDQGTATFQFESSHTGRQTTRTSSVPKRDRKSDYIEDILEMLNQGMSQKDIAFELGISPAYVCQLLKKYR